MSRARTITRRTLLAGTAAVAGGAAFGAWWIARDPPNPIEAWEGATALNPFVIVDGEGVTVVAPRAEMGQGTHTTLAALVAEEMDLDWDGVRVIHGPAARAYWNGAIMGLGLPFPEYARTEFQGRLALGMALMAKGVGVQVTGGSTSTVDAFERMRAAGALARETLLVAGGRRLRRFPEDLRTERGHVVAPDGTGVAYADLAGDLAGIEPPERVTLRDPSEWRLLGRPLPRTDMVAKSTGTAAYGIDTRLPGMLHAAPRLSPRLGGAMLGFDPAPALAMPGVREVVDLGGGVAAIASDSWTAMRAAEAVAVEWGPAPYPETTEAMAAAIEAALDGPRDSRLRDEGDVDALGPPTLEASYAVPWLAHATMEPMNATALVTDGAAEIWCGNQAPTLIRDHVAAALDLPGEAVTVHTPFLGGGLRAPRRGGPRRRRGARRGGGPGHAGQDHLVARARHDARLLPPHGPRADARLGRGRRRRGPPRGARGPLRHPRLRSPPRRHGPAGRRQGPRRGRLRPALRPAPLARGRAPGRDRRPRGVLALRGQLAERLLP